MAPANTNFSRVHMTKNRHSRRQSAERKALHRVVVGPSPTVGGIAGAGSLRSMCTLPCALCCVHSPRRPPVRYPRCIPGFRGHDIYTAGSSAPLLLFFSIKYSSCGARCLGVWPYPGAGRVPLSSTWSTCVRAYPWLSCSSFDKTRH